LLASEPEDFLPDAMKSGMPFRFIERNNGNSNLREDIGAAIITKVELPAIAVVPSLSSFSALHGEPASFPYHPSRREAKGAAT
jgi:hypothetical protein